MKTKYPTTKAGLLRLVKETEANRLSERRRADNFEERLRDARGDVTSARKHATEIKNQLNEMRVAYAGLRGYTLSMIDAEMPPPSEDTVVAEVYGQVHVQQNMLPPNFPPQPDSMYDRDDSGRRLPF